MDGRICLAVHRFLTVMLETGGYPKFGKFQQKCETLGNQLLMLIKVTKIKG